MPQRLFSVPRLRLLALWISQVAHFAGTYALRVFVVLRVGGEGVISSGSAWHLVTALFMAPSILLVPLYGALANSLPRPFVLRMAALSGLAVAALFTWLNDDWLTCALLAALGSASYAPTRLALLPAAAQETGVPLGTVVGAIEAGSVLAIVAGTLQSSALGCDTFPGQPETPAAMIAVCGWYVLCLAAASVVRFPSDSRRTQSAARALLDFFDDAARLLQNPVSRGHLVAIGYLRGVVTAGVGAFIAASLEGATSPPLTLLLRVALVTMTGTALGSFLVALDGDRRHAASQVRLGALGLTLGLLGVALFCQPSWPLCFVIGTCGGLVNVPLLAAFQRDLDPGARGNAMALLNTTGYLAMTVASALLAGLAHTVVLTPIGQFYFVAGLAALGTAGTLFYRGGATQQLVAYPALTSRSPE